MMARLSALGSMWALELCHLGESCSANRQVPQHNPRLSPLKGSHAGGTTVGLSQNCWRANESTSPAERAQQALTSAQGFAALPRSSRRQPYTEDDESLLTFLI